jgi:5-methylcytosine-specific restriction endonuclease McrA
VDFIKGGLVLEVGQILGTNFWGNVEVVEYANSRNITVRFANTGNIQNVQLSSLRKGLVADTQERARRAKDKFEQERLKAEAYKSYVADCIRRKEEQKIIARADREAKAAAAKEAAELKRKDAWLGKYVDKFGWELEVVDERPGWVDLIYTKSGNKYSIQKMRFKNKGEVVPNDKLHPDYEWAAFLLGEEKSTEKVSESRKQAAKDWQKANAHKYRAALKVQQERLRSAVGSHTKEELKGLLETQGHKCACCGDSLEVKRNKHKDHKTPVSKGGTDNIDNIQYLCSVCNKIKGTKELGVWGRYKDTEVFKRKWEKVKGRKWNDENLKK